MPVFSKQLTGLAAKVLAAARARKMQIATAESCTGGLISGCLTEVAGSSDVFDRGFVTYSNASKMKCLKVAASTLKKYGAVSAETVSEMAVGALKNSNAGITVAVTGIAGPGGATPGKPVGLVYIAVASRKKIHVVQKIFKGNRAAVRLATVKTALELLKKEI